MRTIMRTGILVAATILFGLAQTPTAEVRIDFVCRAMNSEFWQSVRSGDRAAAEANPDILLIVMAPEAVQAKRAQALVVGFDAVPEACRRVLDGGLAATVAQNSLTSATSAWRPPTRHS